MTEKKKVGIHCPICGRKQSVDEQMWIFQATEGHGYTCPTPTCPSHTYLELDEGETCAVKRKS